VRREEGVRESRKRGSHDMKRNGIEAYRRGMLYLRLKSSNAKKKQKKLLKLRLPATSLCHEEKKRKLEGVPKL